MASRGRSLGRTPYGTFIGRVGVLAVALGIGGAVAAGPGAAWADDSPSDGGTATASSVGGESSKPSSDDSPRDAKEPSSGTSPTPADEPATDREPPEVARTPKGSGDAGSGQGAKDDAPVHVEQSDASTLEIDSGEADPPPGGRPDEAVAEDGSIATGLHATQDAQPDSAHAHASSARTRTTVPTAPAPLDDQQPAAQEPAPPAAPTSVTVSSVVGYARPHTDSAAFTRPAKPIVAATDVGSAVLVAVATRGSDLLTMVSTALSNLLASTPADRAESPLLWAMMAWTRRKPAAPLTGDTVQDRAMLASNSQDTPTTSVFFGTSPRVVEADGTVLVPIVRSGDLTHASTVEYGITDDTATSGADYLGGSGTVTIEAGQDRVYIPVQVLDDHVAEPTETFVVSIVNVDGGSTILYPRTTRIDILDDENPVIDPPSPPLTSNYRVTEQVVVSDLNQPIAFEFAHHDPSLMYIAEKGGVIKVFDVDTGRQATFVDITDDVNDIQDRGLMDIALHPDFGTPVAAGQPEHNYVYAFYVVDPAGTQANPAGSNAGADGGGNRFAYLVRFTADEATGYTTVVPGSEVILLGGKEVPGESELQPRTLQDISGAGVVDSTSDLNQPESGFDPRTGEYVDNYVKVDSRSHAGGSLAFGPDGALYVSIGDGTSFNTTDPRSVSVQDLDSLSDKILRIDPTTGLGLPDNPFVEPGDDLSANRSKVYQLGLRNPFSMAFSDDGRLFITNTGWNTWEEIESGHAGANFGWPYFEGGDTGIARTSGYQNLAGAAAFYAAVANGTITITPAHRAFAHSDAAPGFQVGAIVGVDDVYTGTRYPTEFQNDVFFTDVNDGEVYVVDINDRSDVKYLFRSNGTPVAFGDGPDGYVYVANLGDGTITRLLIERSDGPIVDPNGALEKQLEALRRDTGWIPLWGSGISAAGFVLVLYDLVTALRDSDAADVADEVGDLIADGLGIGLGLLPWGTVIADQVAEHTASLLRDA